MAQAAEKAKRELDGLAETDIQLPFISATPAGAVHLNVRISRAKFEGMVQFLLDKTLDPCKKCLKDANVKKSDIKEVGLRARGRSRARTHTAIVVRRCSSLAA